MASSKSEQITLSQKIATDATALLASSPFYFKPVTHVGVIPLLAIKTIEPETTALPLKGMPFVTAGSHPIVKVRLVGDDYPRGYELSLDEATRLVEKLRQLPKTLGER